jgi:two-component system CheB/CheR fusion protein
VEDNVDAAETLQDLLSTAGHAVRVAQNGPEALEALVTDEPDLVLLDIGLPGMDGYEVAKEIRRRVPSRPPVLVAVTGYGREEDRARARAAGIDYHLVKPVDFHALEQILATPLRDPWRSA